MTKNIRIVIIVIAILSVIVVSVATTLALIAIDDKSKTKLSTDTITCPSGFIVVPGSKTKGYSSKDFCVMKYEAKKVKGVATSQATLSPWVSISQTSAIDTSKKACKGCHLITESEWMTIAQNILSVPSNWSGGKVGKGYVFSGHNDGKPAKALIADVKDSNGYKATENSASESKIASGGIIAGKTQRRTLTLTNGEVIWDIAGNVWEWTSGQVTGGQPGRADKKGYTWQEWNNVDVAGSSSVNPFPGYGSPAAGKWNSMQGIGQLSSYANETGKRGFIRGGAWSFGGFAGVTTLYLNDSPDSAGMNVGFRVSK